MKDKRTGTLIDGCVADFIIRPEPKKKWFYTVKIFTNKSAIKRYLRDRPWMGSLGRYGIAMCMSWTVEQPNGRVTGECGEIVLPWTHFDPEIISHECAHAVLNWSKRVGMNPLDDGKSVKGQDAELVCGDNERFCQALGQLVIQIVGYASRKKLFDE